MSKFSAVINKLFLIPSERNLTQEVLGIRPYEKNIKVIPPWKIERGCLSWTVHCGILGTERTYLREGQ